MKGLLDNYSTTLFDDLELSFSHKFRIDSPKVLKEQIKYIKSPLNYTGGKYKLLNQIIPLFPKNIETFVDLFAGGFNVGINVKADYIIANDINAEIINLLRFFQKHTVSYILTAMDKIVEKYGFSNTAKNGYAYYGSTSSKGVAEYNKKPFIKLRQDYNSTKDPILFYALIVFSFNNQIRFNSKGEFNMPVNKRDFNNKIRRNLKVFVNQLQNKNVEFISMDYKNVPIPSNSFVYIDPPYLVAQATYNENNGWNESKEIDLLNFIDELDRENIKFALSNVFENKTRKNYYLIEWSNKYHVTYLDYSYANCNYQKTIREKAKEVLVTNYRIIR